MNILQQTPPITRNLILINCAVFLAQYVCGSTFGIDLADGFGLHFMLAKDFGFWQVVTYMFLHGGLTHLFFNMFALWMFGVVIERTLGRDRFLVYYFVCGIGAALCQELWQLGQYYVEGLASYSMVATPNGSIPMSAYLNMWNTVGASGACYGILLAFGVLYPEQRIMLLIPPIPMKAKYFVFAYAVIEAVSAFTSNGNIAHFAHLGGMLFGWMLLRHWRRNTSGQGHFSSWDNYNPKKPSAWQRIKKKLGLGKDKSSPAQGVYGRNADYDYNLRRKRQEERIDEILDKVRKSGYDSLTREEKQELFQNSSH